MQMFSLFVPRTVTVVLGILDKVRSTDKDSAIPDLASFPKIGLDRNSRKVLRLLQTTKMPHHPEDMYQYAWSKHLKSVCTKTQPVQGLLSAMPDFASLPQCRILKDRGVCCATVVVLEHVLGLFLLG